MARLNLLEPRIQQAITMCRAGANNTVVGQALGVHRETVRRWRAAAGITPWVRPAASKTRTVRRGSRTAVDEVSVIRACRGERIDLGEAERRVAVARLWGQRYPDAAIAERLRISYRTVLRIRHTRLGLSPVPFEQRRQAS